MVLSSLSATLRINASTKPGSAMDGTIATTVLTRQHALPASMWICFAVPTLANAFPNSRSAIESSIATTVPTSKTAVATREHSGCKPTRNASWRFRSPCILWHWVCNKRKNCPQGEDESPYACCE